MFEVRIHGRGGQGVVTAAEMLSVAAFVQGRQAQAFPSFGSERTGAPVVAYCRVDDVPIRPREPVVTPDAVIVQDATLLPLPGVLDGVRPGGCVLINSGRTAAELGLSVTGGGRLLTVPASEIALRHLGRPLPNAVLLGGFAALSGLVSIDSVAQAIAAKFAGRTATANIAAARQAFADVTRELEELADAQAG